MLGVFLFSNNAFALENVLFFFPVYGPLLVSLFWFYSCSSSFLGLVSSSVASCCLCFLFFLFEFIFWFSAFPLQKNHFVRARGERFLSRLYVLGLSFASSLSFVDLCFWSLLVGVMMMLLCCCYC